MDAIQLYTLRNVEASVTELLERVADAGFDGVEFAYRVRDADTAPVRDVLDETGLTVPSAHVRIDDLEEDLESTVQFYRDVECERIVVPYLDDDHFEDRAAVEATAARLDALADRLAEYEYSLHYHNHDAEFTELDDGTALDVLCDETDSVAVELDVGLAADAGADPVAYIEEYGERIELLHATDTDRGERTETHARFGTGDVDYGRVFAAAEGAGIEWYVYENGSSDDPEAELQHARDAFVGR